MTEGSKDFSSINKRLVFYTVLVSALFTTLTTVINFGFDYSTGVENQNEMLVNLKNSNLSSIEHGIWDLDEELLKNDVKALINIPSIISVSVLDQNNKKIISSSITNKDSRLEDYSKTKVINVYKKREDSKEQIGSLSIQYTQFYLYKNLINRLIFLFLTQLIKTFAVSFVLLFIFKTLFSTYLVKIATFYSDQLENKEKSIHKLSLGRKDKQVDDEFSLIEDSFNSLIKRINTSKEKTQKELELKEDALHKLSQLATFGEMAGNIGHEINNPLTIIKGSVYILRKEMKKENLQANKNIMESLQKMDETADRILKISKSLSTLARNEKIDDTQVEKIGELVEEITSLVDEKMKTHNISFEYSVENPKTNVLVNRIQLGQVLFNIINNAIFEVKNQSNNWIKLIVSNDEVNVFFKIIDSGIGISKEVQDNIFIPFYTTKKVGDGTGLGLSIASKIIKKYGGQIYIDNEASNTTFCIKLPINKQGKTLNFA